MLTKSSLLTVLGIAAFTVAAGLGVALPKTTFADGDAQYTEQGTRVNQVLLNGQIVRDQKSKTGWSLVVTAENKADEVTGCEIAVDLTRTSSSPMGRSRPMPAVVWETKDVVSVAAHGKTVKRYEIPATYAAQLTATAQEQAKQGSAQGDPVAARPITTFAVSIRRNA